MPVGGDRAFDEGPDVARREARVVLDLGRVRQLAQRHHFRLRASPRTAAASGSPARRKWRPTSPPATADDHDLLYHVAVSLPKCRCADWKAGIIRRGTQEGSWRLPAMALEIWTVAFVPRTGPRSKRGRNRLTLVPFPVANFPARGQDRK